MKKGIAKMGVSTFAALLVFFIAGATYAQDMSIWTGQWFQATVSYSGKYDNGSGGMGSYKEKEVNYLKIQDVDQVNRLINFLGYFYEEDQWQEEYITWRYFGESNLNFLSYYFECEGENIYCFGFTAQVQGKMQDGILKSGTIKSLGGLEWNAYDGQAAGVTFKGKLIAESSVPAGIPR